MEKFFAIIIVLLLTLVICVIPALFLCLCWGIIIPKLLPALVENGTLAGSLDFLTSYLIVVFVTTWRSTTKINIASVIKKTEEK